MAFSDNVKALREKKGYSQAELARLASVSQPTVNDYEKGKKLPTIVTGVDLAKALGVTVEELVCGSGK